MHLACARHEHFLPNGHRAGFFLGDGPGVGKGRQIAALVTENLLRKRGNCRVTFPPVTPPCWARAKQQGPALHCMCIITLQRSFLTGPVASGRELQEWKSFCVQALWFSASADLALDATRDFWDIGAYKYACSAP